VGEKDSLFEHPAGFADPVGDIQQSRVSGVSKELFNSLLGLVTPPGCHGIGGPGFQCNDKPFCS
jgi:hypothetical protein